MSEKKQITEWFGSNGITYTESQIDKLTKYLEMIRSASGRMNIVSRHDLPRLVERHLLDSLQALTVYDFTAGLKAADLGSGGGFPGVPLAVMLPQISFDLIESRRMKSLFLKSVVDVLQLNNTTIIHDRWENLKPQYDIVLARAVYNEENIRAKVLPLLPPNAVVLHFLKLNNINILKNSKN